MDIDQLHYKYHIVDHTKRGASSTLRGFKDNYLQTDIFQNVKDPKEADFFVFTGGLDVDPDLYFSQAHPKTQSNPLRDKYEKDMFHLAQEMGIKCVGICRGAQFLCVMSGGDLIQHTNNHARNGTHATRCSLFANSFKTNSLHHQMMYPHYLNSNCYEVLAWSENQESTLFEGSGGRQFFTRPEDQNEFKEPEAVWFKQSNCLGIQWHPEYAGFNIGSKEAFIITLKFLRNAL